MDGVYTIPQIKSVVSDCAARYGAERVFLFGSYARGEMTEESDIDLRLDKGSIRGLQLAGMLCDLEDAFGKHVDLLTTGALDDLFLQTIAGEEIMLYEHVPA